MSDLTIGVNDYYRQHNTREMGNSYAAIPAEDVVRLVSLNWAKRTPGAGEGENLSRKVLVPIDTSGHATPLFFCPPRVKLERGMPVQAEVVVRQEGEDPYVETFITPEDAARYGFIETPAKDVQVVVYSREALSENNGRPTTPDCQWEIVTLLCSPGKQEPMTPLTMARNYLEKEGGTKGEYTAGEFAEAIYFHSASKGLKVRRKRP